MTILITGGAKNGKSRIGEDILRSVKNDKFYIATMISDGEEAERIIYRHRQARAGKGFLTIEQPRNIGELALPLGSSALLECIPTLTANEMFSEDGKGAVGRVVSGVAELAKSCETLVVVTSNVSSDGVDYPAETREYIRAIGEINRILAEFSDTVVEAVCGIPIVLKGALP